MNQFNQTTILGNVVRDPEVYVFANGNEKISFTVANNKTFKTQGGEEKKETLFLDVTLNRKAGDGFAKVIKDYVKKGSQVIVNGELYQDNWVDKATNEKRMQTRLNLETLNLVGGKPTETQSEPTKPRKAEKQHTYSPPVTQDNGGDDVPF